MAKARQERAEVTREAILEGAAEAFDAAGFGSTSLSDISQRAGVTKGALYFHFPSKEALAHTLMMDSSTSRHCLRRPSVRASRRPSTSRITWLPDCVAASALSGPGSDS